MMPSGISALPTKDRSEAILFALAFFVRALYAFAVQIVSGSHGFISHADAEFFYYRLAHNLVAHRAFSIADTAPYIPDAYHTPLYPIFAAFFEYMHLPFLAVVMVQSAVAALTVIFMYKIALKITDAPRVAFFSALFMSIEPMSIYWNGLLMSDVLFAFFMTLAFYVFIAKDRTLTGLALGFAALTRPIAMYFAPVFIAMILYQGYRARRAAAEIFKEIALMVILIVVCISPWIVRNALVFSEWAYTSAGWYELYIAPLQDFAHQKGYAVPDVLSRIPPEENLQRFDFKYEPQYKSAFLSVVSQDPFGYAVVHIQRSLRSLFTDRYEYLLKVVLQSQVPGVYNALPPSLIQTVLGGGQLLLIMVYALCVCSLLRKDIGPWVLFFAALYGINALLSGAINPGGSDMSRYSLALYGPLVMIAIVGLTEIAQRLKAWQHS